jgi:1-acyl-sn-glycerol-3-phosphate acyltransferase
VLIWTLVRDLVLVLLALLYRVRRVGASHVPASGPALFVSNHQSHLDPLIAGVLVADRPFASMARASLFRFKPFGAFIRLFGAVPIERGRGDRSAMRAFIDELEHGRCVLLFPEGTRTPDGRVGQFHPGALMLARRGGAPIVPVAIEGAFEVWPRARPRPRLRGRVAVMAGEPLGPGELEHMGDAQVLERLRRQIESMRLELRAGLRRATRGRVPPPGPADRAYWEGEG